MKTYHFIYKTTKGYRVQLFLLFLTVVLATVTGTFFPYAIGKIVDEILYNHNIRGFLLYFGLYAGLYSLNQLFHGGLNYIWAHLKITYLLAIRKKCFRHLMYLRGDLLSDLKGGDITARIQNDVECFLEFIHRSVFYIIGNILQLVVAIGYLFITNVYLGLVAVVMTPIMAYSIRYFTRKLEGMQTKVRKDSGILSAWIVELINGMSEWKMLNAGHRVQESYLTSTEDILKQENHIRHTQIVSQNVNEVLTLIGQLAVYLIAVYGIVGEFISVGQFVACAAYFATCASYFNALGSKINGMSFNLVGIKRVMDFLEEAEETDSESAQDIRIEFGAITFDKVSFSYDAANSLLEPKGGTSILNEVSFSICQGEKVALVGESGSGKSTLLHLLYRLYEPDCGKILIDGFDIKTMTLRSLRMQIAVVQQNSRLFHGSVRKNITFQDDSALDEETEEYVNQFIMSQFPDTTILFSAHRPSSIQKADWIVRLEGGAYEI